MGENTKTKEDTKTIKSRETEGEIRDECDMCRASLEDCLCTFDYE
jgi:hypothetical protein